MRARTRAGIGLISASTCGWMAALPAQAAVVHVAVAPGVTTASRAGAPASEWVHVVIPRGDAVQRVSWSGRESTQDLPVLGVSGWNGWQIATVQVPELGDGTIELHTVPGHVPPIARQRAHHARRRDAAALVRSQVANPDDVDRFAPPAGVASSPKHSAFHPAAYPDLEGSDVEYVIVTSNALAPAFQVLADWKTRRGVPTVVRTIESITATTRNGSDLQETIRTFLQQAYAKWSVQWVLLGGDTEIIPARFLSSSFASSSAQQIPSDLYFACLDGTFNADGDALWGEAPQLASQPDPDGADLLAEVYVARAPVTTAAEVATFVQKVIAYETPLDPNYQGNTLFLGEVLFPTNWDTSQAITMDGGQLSEDIIMQRWGTSDGIRRRYEDAASFPGALPLTRAESLVDLDAGFNLVNHIGHGFRYNMSVGDQSIVNADADALANGNRLAVMNILNCTSLAFDYSCLGEHFIRNAGGGAAAVVGASRSAYPLPAREYQDDWYELLLHQDAWRLGELFARSRLNLTPLATLDSAHRWTHYIYNVLGEPEMAVFSRRPRSLQVLHPASLDLGTTDFAVTVSDSAGAPIDGARVCLHKGDDDYQVALTDVNGVADMSFRAESPGDVQLTVSGRDLRTFLIDVPVGASVAPYVHVSGFLVDDDAVGGTSGNGDGSLDAGEICDLTLVLRNDGGAAASSVTGIVLASDPYAIVPSGAFASGPIAAGGTAIGAPPVRVSLAAGAPDGHAFELQLDILAGAVATQDRVRKEIHAPSLRVVRLEVLDAASGNGDGVPDEGETFGLRIWVKNFGSGRVDGLQGELLTSSPNVTILQNSAAFGSIGPHLEGSNTIPFELIEDLLEDNRIDLRLTDDRGRLLVHRFELRRPAPPLGVTLDATTGPTVIVSTWPPVLDPDVAGYHVYRALEAGGPWARVTTDATAGIRTYRDAALQTSTRYYYSITAMDSSGSESERSPVNSASTNPPQLAGWPIEMSSETASSAALGDLDGDGLLEIVQGNRFVYAWHGSGQEVRDADGDAQTWGVFSTDTGITNAAVVLAELDGTSGLEVVSCNWDNNRVQALDGDGDLLWMRQPSNGGPQGYWGTPAAADVDRDGFNEVFAVSKDGRLYAWNHDGSPLMAGNADGTFALIPQYTRSSPAIGNLDEDFELEIVLTDVAGNLHGWNFDGTNMSGFPRAFGNAFYNSPVLGDVDGDGRLEIVAISISGAGNFHCLRGNGTELPGFPFTMTLKAPAVAPSPALADLDGDGRLEIIAASLHQTATSSQLYVFRHDGSLYPGWPQPIYTDSESSPIIADFDGDGWSDIVFGGQDGVLRGWKRDGSELLGFPLAIGDFVRGTPAVGDVDGDGGLDLVLAAWDKSVYVWDFPVAWNAARAQWPAFLHDAQRTARFGFEVLDATDAGVEPEIAAPPARLSLGQNHPNPFNPTTSIRFGIPAGGGHVQLGIFDVRGRGVRTLVEGELAPGHHRVLWDGRDKNGRSVPSGVYFYRLRWRDDAVSRRMLMVR